MQSFMKRLVRQRDKLSQLEKQVLNYITRDPQKITKLNLSEAAQKMYVSTATISRTCKKLGFQGYQEFKLQLQLNINNDHQVESEILTSHLNYHIQRYEKDMLEVIKRVDENDLETSAQMIKEANYIEWIGVGHSYPVCWDASKKLQLLGKKSVARMDWDDLRSTTFSLTKHDLAIFVSYSGETLNILEFAHLVKNRGTPILSFVGTRENQLADLSNKVIYTPIENYYLEDLDLSFRGPFQMLADLILVQYHHMMNQS